MTPTFVGHPRGDEIEAWLLSREDAQQFVILDDGNDMGVLLPHLAQTSWRTGLLDEHVDRAIALLKNA